MASLTRWKIRDRDGVMILQAREPVDAARAATVNPKCEVYFDHKALVWREGKEAFRAKESPEAAAKVMEARAAAYSEAFDAAMLGAKPMLEHDGPVAKLNTSSANTKNARAAASQRAAAVCSTAFAP